MCISKYHTYIWLKFRLKPRPLQVLISTLVVGLSHWMYDCHKNNSQHKKSISLGLNLHTSFQCDMLQPANSITANIFEHLRIDGRLKTYVLKWARNQTMSEPGPCELWPIYVTLRPNPMNLTIYRLNWTRNGQNQFHTYCIDTTSHIVFNFFCI